MERITNRRATILIVLFCVILCFFAYRLYDLQIIETGGSTDNTTTFVTVTRVKAARGDILDRNGNVLVSNRASYDLAINHYVLTSATGTNNYLYQLVKLCQERGITYAEHFPVSNTRPFTYTLSDYSSTWQGYFQAYLAYKGALDSDITAPLLIQTLRTRYKIPAEWSDEDARLVIGLWYELDLRNGVTNLPNYVFLSDASDEDLSAILELNIPGLNVEASTVREYNTDYAAHILGFVGPMTAEQWEIYKDLGYSMDAEVGQSGFEQAFEEYLHGTDGLRVDKTAADGTLVESYYTVEPQAGNNVEVTIDINLQMAGEDMLAQVLEDLRAAGEENPKADGADAEGGAVVAIDVRTGQVLACASYPTYNLSTYFQDYTEILQQPYSPLINRALGATYPPGSTYKMSMVVAGIDSGAIGMYTEIEDMGVFRKYQDSGFAPSCLAWTTSRATHGKLTAATALKYSCNYFFYQLGDWISVETIDATAKGLGLGEPTGVELPELTGYRANEETKKLLHTGSDAYWYPADKISAAIGQSDNKFTPMQLAVYTATLANQGTRYRATFLNRVVSADYRSLIAENQPEILSVLDISDEAYAAYSQGMQMVASQSGGTAYAVFGNYPIPVAAKTGTAQTGITGSSDNGSFVCYAPADDPQIAVVVYGEKAGHGKTVATVAKAILDLYFDVDEIGDVVIYENQVG